MGATQRDTAGVWIDYGMQVKFPVEVAAHSVGNRNKRTPKGRTIETRVEKKELFKGLSAAILEKGSVSQSRESAIHLEILCGYGLGTGLTD